MSKRDWEIPSNLQPDPGDYSFDLETALKSVVGLRANGAHVEDTEDTMTVHGTGHLTGGAVAVTHLDHRIAMSFLVAGLASDQMISVDDGGPIATSFPDFLPLMRALGARIE